MAQPVVEPVAPSLINWKDEPTYDLWFELPDVMDHIPAIAEKWALGEKEKELLKNG